LCHVVGPARFDAAGRSAGARAGRNAPIGRFSRPLAECAQPVNQLSDADEFDNDDRFTPIAERRLSRTIAEAWRGSAAVRTLRLARPID
jgi:hypothetical protein